MTVLHLRAKYTHVVAVVAVVVYCNVFLVHKVGTRTLHAAIFFHLLFQKIRSLA